MIIPYKEGIDSNYETTSTILLQKEKSNAGTNAIEHVEIEHDSGKVAPTNNINGKDNEITVENVPIVQESSTDTDQLDSSMEIQYHRRKNNAKGLPTKCCFGPNVSTEHVPPNDCISLSEETIDNLYLGEFNLHLEPVRGLTLEQARFKTKYLEYHAQAVSSLKKRYLSHTTANTYLRQLFNAEREVKLFRPYFSIVETLNIDLSVTLRVHSENGEIIVPMVYVDDVEKITVTQTPYTGL